MPQLRKAYLSSVSVLFAAAFTLLPAQTAPKYADLHDFGAPAGTMGPDGQNSYSNVVFDAAGNMYGTTASGGSATSNGTGTVWRISKSGVYRVLHTFGGTISLSNGKLGIDGTHPHQGVNLDKAGNIYGTAQNGGPYGGGIVWRLKPSGDYKSLHEFGGASVTNADGTLGPDGLTPQSGITIDAAGNLFGTTTAGGPYSKPNDFGGILWEITSAGAFKDLHDFGGIAIDAAGQSAADGFGPVVVYVDFDSAGNIYGTTQFGGANGAGTLWRLTPAGSYRNVHDFGGKVTNANLTVGDDGTQPVSGVSIDDLGNIYGTAQFGGPNGQGIVWEFTNDGGYKDLYDFGVVEVMNSTGTFGPDGANPTSGVTFDVQGNLFGTTSTGGLNAGPNSLGGIVWELSRWLEYRDLHDFGGTVPNANNVKGSDGVNVQGGVAFDTLGNLYGASVAGGANKVGMIWKVFSNPIPQKLFIKPAKVVGGTPTTCTIEFSAPAPNGGAVFTMISNSPYVKPPAKFMLPPGRELITVTIPTLAVPSDITPTITAVLNGESATAKFQVTAPTLTAVTVFPTKFVGGRTVKGGVAISSPAPAGGLTIHLSSGDSNVKTPLTVRVAPGAKVATFSITTSKVSANVVATISAVLNSVTRTVQMTITP